MRVVFAPQGAPSYYEKHRAPARAPRAGVYGGGAPDRAISAPLGATNKDGIRRAVETPTRGANPATEGAGGNPRGGGAQHHAPADKKGRALPATALPRRGGECRLHGTKERGGCRNGSRQEPPLLGAEGATNPHRGSDAPDGRDGKCVAPPQAPPTNK